MMQDIFKRQQFKRFIFAVNNNFDSIKFKFRKIFSPLQQKYKYLCWSCINKKMKVHFNLLKFKLPCF